MGRLIFSITLVIVGLGTGYLIQHLNNRQFIYLPMAKTRTILQRAALLFFNPIAMPF